MRASQALGVWRKGGGLSLNRAAPGFADREVDSMCFPWNRLWSAILPRSQVETVELVGIFLACRSSRRPGLVFPVSVPWRHHITRWRSTNVTM